MASTEYFVGKQYHIGLSPGELERYILLCGAPERVAKVAHYFDDGLTRPESRHREFVTVSGHYKGIPLSVMATGIGTDNTEIAVIEATQCFDGSAIRPTFIRIGSCGAIKEGIEVGDLVISGAALPRENTSSFYLPAGTKVFAHPDILKSLESAAQKLAYTFHTGVTCSTSSFYAGQGREAPGFPIRDDAKREILFPELLSAGVLNFEMETSTLFTLAKISTCAIRAGAVCAVYAARHANQGFDPGALEEAEKRCIETGLEAIRILAELDATQAPTTTDARELL